MKYILLVLVDDNVLTLVFEKFCQIVYHYHKLPKNIKAFPYYEHEGELFPLDI